ncbi:hypothetical protein [Streptomyces sp. NPDC048521]|uniref:hypothetical protein n=1 Tax=Streptomyces sp. NPDC048521 TaxID=3365566 RepID=UPI00371ED841
MIEISTYLRNAAGEFTAVEEVTSYDGDPFYVEGALALTVNGVQLIDQSMWDYVDQLWAYLVKLTIEAKKSGRAEVLFPDQPIHLSIERVGQSDLLIRCDAGDGKRVARIRDGEFTLALGQAAERFFRDMLVLIPENKRGYEYELRNVASLRSL